MRKLRAAVGIGFAQLRHRWGRALLGITGVAVAVLATVLLLSLGVSVLDVGSAGFGRIGGDLWVTGGPVTFAPGAVGGIDTQLVGAHDLAADIENTEGVTEARALGFQSVYVGTDEDELETIIGAGVSGDGAVFQTEAGQSFTTANRHYANGSYDGEMTNRALIDKRAAAQLGLEVGDTIHVGGTLVAAEENEFKVIGISNDVARYLGAPTVMLHLGELQRVSSKTGTDPAAAILVTIDDDARLTAVQRDLQTNYDTYEVRTNDEQFESVLQRQSGVIASAVMIVFLAVVGGIALISNVLGLFVYQQRRQLAALRAAGVSVGLLLRTVLVQGLTIAAFGAAIGLLITWPAVQGLNYAVSTVIGHVNLVSIPAWALATGGGLALVMGTLGTIAGGLIVTRVSPLEHLER